MAKEGTPIPIGITASLVNIANQEYVLSVVTSLGVVMFPTENDGVISLLRKTDSAMYEAK